MPDIAMCRNKTCPLRMRCYRYRATPSDFRQSYGLDFAPDADGYCGYYKELYEPYERPGLTPESELP